MATSLGRCRIQGPGPGRPKGSQNRLTSLKEAFVEAFDKTGGVDALVEWAKKEGNRGLFYRILASLLPKQVAVAARLEMHDLSRMSEAELIEIIQSVPTDTTSKKD